MLKLLSLLVVVSLSLVDAGRILCLFPLPSKSHAILVEPLLDSLAKRGHELVVVTPYPRNTQDYTEVDVSEIMNKVNFNFFAMRQTSMLTMLAQMTEMAAAIVETPKMQELIHSTNEHFDMVFGEVVLEHGLVAGFSHKFDAPIVALSSFMPSQLANDMVGNPAPTSYIPDSMLAMSNKMSFKERLINTAVGLAMSLQLNFMYYPEHDELMRKHFGQHLPQMMDIIKNTSLVLVNHHFSIAYPRPYVANMVEVGGMHVKDPQPIPEELKHFLDSATDGAILFSLGSNAKSKDMGEERIQALLDAFTRINLKVLWKFENENLTGKPDNVKISKWLPQSDILAHPNIKLFITHGGLLSTTEAIIRGVPIIGIPILGDQIFNMKQAETDGIGKTLEFESITSDNVVNMINQVLNDSKYTKNIQERSRLFKDSPMTPLDRAVFWVEYVLRHKGAHNMRSAAQDLYSFQLYLLDVYAVLLTVGLVILLFVRCVVKRCCRRRQPKTIVTGKKDD